MKKYLLVFALVVTGLSFAQDKGKFKDATPEERAEMQTKKMAKDLTLNQEQEQKVNAILKEHHANLEAKKEEIKSEQIEAKKERRKKAMSELKENRSELKEKLKGVLTEEQYKKWETLQNERLEKAKNYRKNGNK